MTRNAFVVRARVSLSASSLAWDIPWLSGVAVCQAKGFPVSAARAVPAADAVERRPARMTKTRTGLSKLRRGVEQGRFIVQFPHRDFTLGEHSSSRTRRTATQPH